MEKIGHYHSRYPKMISQAQALTLVERHAHRLLFIIGAIIGFYVVLPDENLYLNAIATVGAFLSSLTGVSITAFLSLRSDIADALQKRGWYKILMSYAHSAVILSLSMLLAAIVGFFVSDEYESIYKVILFGLFFSALGAFYRIFFLLIRIGGFHREEQQ